MAMIYPEPEKGGRGHNRKETLPFSKMRLSQARAVLRHSLELAQSVLSGGTKFEAADRGKVEKLAASTRRDPLQRQLDRVRVEAHSAISTGIRLMPGRETKTAPEGAVGCKEFRRIGLCVLAAAAPEEAEPNHGRAKQRQRGRFGDRLRRDVCHQDGRRPVVLCV